MFIDSVTLTLSAGKGGNGVIAWRREKYIPKGGPTGGDGGHGGSIILRAERQTLSLESYRNKRIIRAENGACGGSNRRQGKRGANLVLSVPCGTLVKDKNTQEVLFDLVDEGQEVLICRGGKGGKGNDYFKSPTNQAPNICTEGTFGEAKEVELELKLIADIGLIGMPNAGKSTLLSKLAFIPVKIGAYPFTTLYPNLGYIHWKNGQRLLLADIPGIVKDAHLNKGLGLAFLRHIERTSALIFMIDISGIEGRDPVEDYLTLRDELDSYQRDILQKPFLIVLNKIDEEGADQQVQQFMERVSVDPSRIFAVSAREDLGLDALLSALKEMPLKETLLAGFPQ